MGSLLLAGNLLLAVPVRQNSVVIRSAEQSEREIRAALTTQLTQRGLEMKTARHFVAEYFGNDGTQLAAQLMQLSMLFPELKRTDIISDIASQVLHRQTVALDDYDCLVGMMSRLEGVRLSKSHYDRIRQCVLLNRTVQPRRTLNTVG